VVLSMVIFNELNVYRKNSNASCNEPVRFSSSLLNELGLKVYK
jgi:hypothetical protein